jgi:hypothetical protein
METLIIYKSKYGSTKQYAEWIAKAVGAKAIPLSEATPGALSPYSTLVFGGHLHASSIGCSAFVRKNWGLLSGKKIIIFTVSGSPPSDPGLKSTIGANFPPEILRKAKIFPLRGRAGKLDWLDGLLMLFPKAKAYLEYKKTGDRRALEAYEKMLTFDFMDKKSIAPIVKAIKR